MKCRLCGFEGPGVSPGLHRLKSGKFVAIEKCDDRKACQARRVTA